MRRASILALLAALLAPAAGPAPEGPAKTERSPAPEDPLQITVVVLEDAWRVGDEKTYTLMFDRAPLGRHAMRLAELRDLPDGDREAVFRQRITLDLRALGQEGTLEQSGTIVYRRETAGPYRYREAILREGGYGTYRGRAFRSTVEVELDPDTGTYRVGRPEGPDEEGTLPPAAGAVLLDLLALGHWERVFNARETWPLGETIPLPLLVPSEFPRLDYHLPILEPRRVDPDRVRAELTIEGIEEVELFGARVRAFRCSVSPGGLTLWVSPRGGILRFDTGRGLTGALEP